MRTTESFDDPDLNSEGEPTEQSAPAKQTPASAPSADDAAPTDDGDDLSDRIESDDGVTLSEDPVLANEPELPNDPELPSDQDPKVTSDAEEAGASAESNDQGDPDATTSTRELNWMGYVAFATGALALSIVAIALGHLGLSAVKRGRASNRGFALAGMVLGYIGLVATVLGLWFLLNPQTAPERVDVQAQQDVSAVGAAAATVAVGTDALPDVSQTDTGYEVAGQTIDTHLEGERELTFTGDGPANWCLDITYEGGVQTAFSYTATTGMAEGRCAG